MPMNWLELGSAEGYRLEAATDAGFTNVVGSSVTADVNLSTLTIVSGLGANSTYYFRVGGLNWNNVARRFGDLYTDMSRPNGASHTSTAV